MPYRHLIKRSEGLEVCELPENQMLVYDRQKRMTHYLNSATALVWIKCDGSNNHIDLEKIVQSELSVPKAKVTVRDALDRLNRLNLLEY